MNSKGLATGCKIHFNNKSQKYETNIWDHDLGKLRLWGLLY